MHVHEVAKTNRNRSFILKIDFFLYYIKQKYLHVIYERNHSKNKDNEQKTKAFAVFF